MEPFDLATGVPNPNLQALVPVSMTTAGYCSHEGALLVLELEAFLVPNESE
jgi:hypothetical protein